MKTRKLTEAEKEMILGWVRVANAPSQEAFQFVKALCMLTLLEPKTVSLLNSDGNETNFAILPMDGAGGQPDTFTEWWHSYGSEAPTMEQMKDLETFVLERCVEAFNLGRTQGEHDSQQRT